MSPATDYRSWSFADRSFLFALLVSLLWHLFWFFAVTIVVTPPKKAPQTQPVIVSLGPVLNDAIFKTLVESRPEISRAFYRPPADFSSATEAPVQTIQRYAPGDVVSVPVGKKIMAGLKELVGGGKASPDDGIPVFTSSDADDYFELSASSGVPRILAHPPMPGGIFAAAPTEIEFSVDAQGRVADPEITASSGDPSADAAWEDHLRQWIFAGPGARLRVRFRAPAEGSV